MIANNRKRHIQIIDEPHFIETDDFFAFADNRKAFCTAERILTTKGKVFETLKTNEHQKEIIRVIPSLADNCDDTSKVFAHDIISKLASYCEACENTCNGYGKNKIGVITKQVIVTCAKLQHSEQYFENLLSKLVQKRANHADFVALLRHRCVKLPLDFMAKKLAENSILFGNVLEQYLNGFGTDEFCQSAKEQRKAEQIAIAMLSCPTLDLEFDKSNGRLLLAAVLSPFTSAAKIVIADKRVVWNNGSATEIAYAMKNFMVFEETRIYLLNIAKIQQQLTTDEQMLVECSPALERNTTQKL